MALAIANLGVPMIASADPLENLPYALSGGTPNIDARLRYENVDQELPAPAAGVDDSADALTLRTRLGYTTGKWSGVDGQVEFEDVTVIGKDDYNSTENGKTTRRVIADPEGTELNQAWIRYAGPAKTTVKYGRQRIIFDNARFVGNVGWRQREQTYDGLLLTNSFLPKTTLNYAFITNVNAFRFFNHANTGTAANLKTNRGLHGQLINLGYAHSKALSLTAYGYLLDFQTNPTLPVPANPAANGNAPSPIQPGNPTGDSQTIGLRATGAIPVQDFTLSYALEYADQGDYADAPSTVDADYKLIELGAAYKQVGLKLGYEVLGGDGVYAFQTPLATMHAFQGWADMFLTTPAAGIQETYVTLTGTVEKVSLMARWSKFDADEGSLDYGDELNLQATRPLNDQLGVGLKYAKYSGEADAPVAATGPASAARGDVTKYWAWIEYKF